MEELMDIIGPTLLAAIVTMAIIFLTTFLIFSQTEVSSGEVVTLGDYIAHTIGSLFPGV